MFRMGAQQAKTMLVIGGCKLSLEREAYDSIEEISMQGCQMAQEKLLVPARGATAHVIDGLVWILGGCKGPKEHLKDVQLLDVATRQVSLSPLKLIQERSCHMSVYSK